MSRDSERQPDEANDEIGWRWHDNVIYGFSFELGDPEKQDWRSDLVFDIDFIAEWVRESDEGQMRFRVAPATLRFQNVGDLSISIDHGDSGGRVAMSELSIGSVKRERLDRPFDYWRWTIDLNAPQGARISFCASGFTQTLREEPVLLTEQHLPRRHRRPAG